MRSARQLGALALAASGASRIQLFFRSADDGGALLAPAPLALWLVRSGVVPTTWSEGPLASHPLSERERDLVLMACAPDRALRIAPSAARRALVESVRERFHDARVHAALVCGASSCPALPTRAFRQATLDATLTSLARALVANPRFVRYEDGQLRVSEIFVWFEADFRRDAGSVLGWLRRYDAGHRLDEVPATATPVRIPYVWSLNDRHG